MIRFEQVSDFSFLFYVYSHLVCLFTRESPLFAAISLVYSLPALHRVSYYFFFDFFVLFFPFRVFTLLCVRLHREHTIIPAPWNDILILSFISQAKRWEEFPNVTLTFDCTDRPLGFYADQEFECMLFHMCDEDGRRIPYMCGSGTAFNQQYRICDWIHNFDCKEANKWYEHILHNNQSVVKTCWTLVSIIANE